MKNTFTCLMLCMLALAAPAQELDSLKAIMGVEEQSEEPSKQINNDLFKVTDKGDSTTVTIGNRDLIGVYDNPDSTRIRVGNREISIVENGDNTGIHVGKVRDRRTHDWDRFKGHWAGLGWGINNFMDDDFTLSREGTASFMDLNTSRSWAINLNFAQYSLGFGTSYFGLVTGMGLEFNNYYFDNNNSLAEIDNHVVAVPLDPANLVRSKLTTTYLKVPLLLEAQFPGGQRCRRAFISAGLVTGLKLGSHAKVVYKGDDGKDKSKDRDDFNISPFRYGVTGRIGFGCINLYAEYFFTSMFVEDDFPTLHPFSIGLDFTF